LIRHLFASVPIFTDDMTDELPVNSASCRGIYRGGLVRLLEQAPWDDGTPVEVCPAEAPAADVIKNMGHVIIAGFGLAGRWVAEIFDRHGIDYIVVEQNPDTVKRQKMLGKKIILGDIAQEPTLISAGIETADILALTIPDEQAVLQSTRVARQLRPGIYIVARTTYSSSGMEVAQLGADAVVKAEQAVANHFYELLLRKLRSASDEKGT
jgi:CPA2 family monovalent cation:H+ antiporter-2